MLSQAERQTLLGRRRRRDGQHAGQEAGHGRHLFALASAAAYVNGQAPAEQQHDDRQHAADQADVRRTLVFRYCHAHARHPHTRHPHAKDNLKAPFIRLFVNAMSTCTRVMM